MYVIFGDHTYILFVITCRKTDTHRSTELKALPLNCRWRGWKCRAKRTVGIRIWNQSVWWL